MFDYPTRKFTIVKKMLKRQFKNKDAGDPFLRTIKLSIPGSHDYSIAKMKLDTGCEDHNLIDLGLVYELGISNKIMPTDDVGCVCLNGEELNFVGVITLQWKGKKFRKIFNTDFYVVDHNVLFWQVILGAKTIHEHGTLKFAGFGGRRQVLPDKSKKEKEGDKARKEKYEKEAKANDLKVKEHKKKKEETQRSGDHANSHRR